MYEPELDDASDFWQGYDTSAAPSPIIQKATFTHFETIPYDLKPTIAIPTFSITNSPPSTTTSLPESTPFSHDTDSSFSPEHANHPDDSYWAQYSSIQGSGDSTVPSPRLPDGRKPSEVDEFGRPILSTDDSELPELQVFESDEPPVATRHDAYLSGAVGASEEFADDAYGRGFDDAFAKHAASQKVEPLKLEEVDSLGLSMKGSPPSVASSISSSVEESDAQSLPSPTGSDTALEGTIRGIYALWRGQNPHRTMEHFLAVVKQAVEA